MFEVEVRGRVGTKPQRLVHESGRERVTWRMAVNGVRQRDADGSWQSRSLWLTCTYFAEQRRDDRVDPVVEALLMRVDAGDDLGAVGRLQEVDVRTQGSAPEVSLGLVVSRVWVPVTAATVRELEPR